MGFSETLVGINSTALDTPLNHMIWLNDYKTYGEDSYVFQNKDILHELYRSPIVEFDEKIIEEVYSYFFNIGGTTFENWLKSTHAYKNLNEILSSKDFGAVSLLELSAIMQAHYDDVINISDYWNIGDMRTVKLSATSGTVAGDTQPEQNITFVIADFDHDTLATPINGHSTSAITLTQKGGLSTKGQVSANNTYEGWASCARRAWCNDQYYNSLQTMFKCIVKPVKKLTSDGNGSTDVYETLDKVFYHSEVEVTGDNGESVLGEGFQYPYYNDVSTRQLGDYWSTRSRKASSASNLMVNASGIMTGGTGDASRYMVCGLCI